MKLWGRIEFITGILDRRADGLDQKLPSVFSSASLDQRIYEPLVFHVVQVFLDVLRIY